MLRRLSILGSLLLAACVPQGPGIGPQQSANCYFKPPTKAEAMAWRSAQRVNTAKSYRKFINAYPRSCYVPEASYKLSTTVPKKPTTVRNIPPAGGVSAGGGGHSGGTGGGRSY
jgi:hypothetical protein